MSIITLYHGTPNEFVTPQYGYGEDKHDYGKGFYLTENIELAKEWAVCRPTETNGWVHKYELDISDLKILDFQKYPILLLISLWSAQHGLCLRHLRQTSRGDCA